MSLIYQIDDAARASWVAGNTNGGKLYLNRETMERELRPYYSSPYMINPPHRITTLPLRFGNFQVVESEDIGNDTAILEMPAGGPQVVLRGGS